MKYIPLILFLLLSCKTTEISHNEPVMEMDIKKCVLRSLPLTLRYGNQIGDYAQFYQDTTISIEKLQRQSTLYNTVVELTSNSRYVWLIINESGKQNDSILIHCLSPEKSVDTEFDIENCRLNQELVEFDSVGNPISSTTWLKKI